MKKTLLILMMAVAGLAESVSVNGATTVFLNDATNVFLDWKQPHYIVSPSNDFSVSWSVPSRGSPAQRSLLTVVNTNSRAAYFSTNGIKMEQSHRVPEPPRIPRIFILQAPSTNWYEVIWDGQFVRVWSGQVLVVSR